MEKILNDTLWQNKLEHVFNSDRYKILKQKVEDEYNHKTVYPIKENVFRALKLVDYNDVKVVILGQDPYHGKNQANGLAFAVNDGIKLPPSLKNIYKTIEKDFPSESNNMKIERNQSFKKGNLLNLARQGVLLLNATLTVQEASANSHEKFGWQYVTDEIIKACNDSSNSIVFMLWGSFAGSKKELITNKNHLVLEAPHPSPLSAYKGFFDCKHFLLANEFLGLQKQINWLDINS